MVQNATAVVADDSEQMESRPITVAAVPAGHQYVERITATSDLLLLPDPPVAGAAAGEWWPPAILDPAWIDRNRAVAQILHIHFGTESFASGHLTAVIRAAHQAGWPVVFTAHDLEHPQLPDQEAYAGQLDELMAGADAVITLTEGAASVIRDRWNRHAQVIRHPSVLAPDTAIPHVRSTEDIRIGVHLKDLRPNVDGPGTVRSLLEAVGRLRRAGMPAVAEIRLHDRVRDDAAREEIRRLCAADEHVALIEHERLSDSELAIALSRLDAYVLPYRYGSHSGWLELCWDLGLPVAAPTVGFYAEQHTDGSSAAYVPGDATTLTEALATLLTAPTATRPGTQERARVIAARREVRGHGDAAIVASHVALYRSLMERASA